MASSNTAAAAAAAPAAPASPIQATHEPTTPMVTANCRKMLQDLREKSGQLSPAVAKRAGISVTPEQLGQIFLAHRMQLMTLTQGMSMAAKLQTAYGCLMDILAVTVRLSTKVLNSAMRKANWHLYANNNVACHIEVLWDSIEKTEKAAVDWARLDNSVEVQLAKKMREQRAKLKHASCDSVEDPLGLVKPMALKDTAMAESSGAPKPPPLQLPEPTLQQTPSSSSPLAGPSISMQPTLLQPMVSAPKQAAAKIVRKNLETAEVEVQLPGGSLVWAPLHVGDDGKKVWAMLPSGEKLGTDITPLLLACSKRLGQKRSAAEMCRASQALQEPPLKQAKASRGSAG